MKFKLNKRILILLCALICLICCILSIRGTFARYVTALKAKSYVELGSWLIAVNDQNVMSNSNFSSKVSPVFNVDSEYIAENKIVPTSTGYVELEIDYSDVKVPFTYTITISQDSSTLIEDLKFTDYFKGATKYDNTSSTISFTNSIIPNGTNTTENFKFTLEWFDDTDDGATLTDIEDTVLSQMENIKLNFNIAFTQIH